MIIVESPAKARTIQKFLGQRWTVKASMGHVRDLPKSRLGVDVENRFEPRYINIRGKADIINALRKSAGEASRVYLATDPDREGEAISWHLLEILNLDHDEDCRVEFHEITKDVVQKALSSPRPINPNLVDAQQARRILDRLVGYKLSPLLWRKIRGGLSAGRVQSVAVRMICDREAEIEAFTPEEYWTITALLSDDENPPFKARFFGTLAGKVDIRNAGEAQRIMDAVRDVPFTVISTATKERRRNPALPFITSTLQQEASRKLGFTVKKTMLIAQQLYEGLDIGPEGTVGLITYLRTDSTRISEAATREARNFIKERFGTQYVSDVRQQPESKKPGIQGAHEAIRPTSVHREPSSLTQFLTPDQFKLYRLIWDRFVASQMSAAVYDVRTADIQAGPYLFKASGSRLRFPGFTVLYSEGEDGKADNEEEFLPELKEGQELSLIGLEDEQHFTQPPPRFTEAMLVKALEEKGIGRPSTYAPIIQTIQDRGYVKKVQRRFVPTDLGKVVVNLLREHFAEIVDIEFTANLEKKLDLIEEGEVSWRSVLEEFYGPFAERLARAERLIGKVEIPAEMTSEKCEKCGRPMVVKEGRYGKFLACSGFPECKNSKPLLLEIGVPCPLCGAPIVERHTKTGRVFYGCSAYPQCSFTSWDKPVSERCPVCGGPMVERRSAQGKTSLKCTNRECPAAGGDGKRPKEAG
ncbi:MAG TPA: type I DNA topoisomerase [Clostridia bacterium]|nr:type I DNA topoisomerase [Clostridia bacterium]